MTERERDGICGTYFLGFPLVALTWNGSCRAFVLLRASHVAVRILSCPRSANGSGVVEG